MKTREKSIQDIMGFCYHYAIQVGWCKAIGLGEAIKKRLSRKYLSEEEKEWERAYLSNPTDLAAKTKLKALFLSCILYDLLPESSAYSCLTDGQWILSENKEYVAIVDEIVRDSEANLKERQDDHLEWIQIYLLEKLNLQSLNDPKAEEPSVKKEIDAYFNRPGVYYNREGKEDGVFSDYERLKRIFLEELFDPGSVHFFVCVDCESVPAVIGIDDKTLGIIWLD